MMDWEAVTAILKRVERNDATLTALDFDVFFPADRKALSLGSLQLKLLSAALEYNTRVKSLRIANHDIGDAGVTFISEMLRVNRSITSLTLENVGMEAAGLISLFYAMRKNQTVRELTIRSEHLSASYLEHEGGMLRDGLKLWLHQSHSIKKITLSHLKIGNDPMLTHDGLIDTIALGLAQNNSLEELTLEDETGIFPSRYALAVLAENVKPNKTLFALNIPYDTNDQVSYRAIREINETLTDNHTVYLLTREPKYHTTYVGSFFAKISAGVAYVTEQAKVSLLGKH